MLSFAGVSGTVVCFFPYPSTASASRSFLRSPCVRASERSVCRSSNWRLAKVYVLLLVVSTCWVCGKMMVAEVLVRESYRGYLLSVAGMSSELVGEVGAGRFAC